MASKPSSAVTQYALLIGICFTPRRRRDEWPPLKGCIRDVQGIKAQLVKSFPSADIVALTASLQHPDDRQPFEDKSILPTYGNIISSLERICSQAPSGSFVYIHFTGHGTAIEPSSQFTSSTSSTGELALVVLAADDGTEMRYLRGAELAFQVRNMVEKKLKVTLVLDCCASGSTVRNNKLDASVKYLPYDPAVDMKYPPPVHVVDPPGREEEEEEEEEGSCSSYRGASFRPNWLVDPDGYVILAACGPTEKAKEINFGNGEWYGALSGFLIRTFVRRGRVGGNQQHIYSHLVARFREKCPGQKPMLYGNKNLGFFTDAVATWHAAPIPIVHTRSGLRLEAGLAHGVSSGDLFSLFPINSGSPAVPGSAESSQPGLRPTVRATRIRALTSDLELADSNTTTALTSITDSGLMATELTRLALRQFPIQLELQVPHTATWATALRDRKSLHVYSLHDPGPPPTPFFLHVTVLANDHYEIRDQQGAIVSDLPATLWPLEENADFVMDVVEHLIRFQLVRELKNTMLEDPTNAFRDAFEVWLVHSAGNIVRPGCLYGGQFQATCVHPDCLVQVKHGDSMELVVRNKSLTTALYMHVFVMSALWEIEGLLHANHEVNPPRFSNQSRDFKSGTDGVWRKAIRMTVPRELQDKGKRECNDFIKRKWNHSSPLTPFEQRTQLIAAYIEEDTLAPELTQSPPSRTPTPAEITTILSPWRPQKLRRIAHRIQNNYPCDFHFLRTYYSDSSSSGDDDAKMAGWFSPDASDPIPERTGWDSEDKWFVVLDDADLFDYGSELDGWQRVYRTLPELAAPGDNRRISEEDLEWAASEYEQYEDDDVEEEHYAVMESLRYTASRGVWLCVIDEKAFEEDNFYFVYRDRKGNVVKEGPCEMEWLTAMGMYVNRGMGLEQPQWVGGVVGKKYRAKGSLMSELLPRVLELAGVGTDQGSGTGTGAAVEGAA